MGKAKAAKPASPPTPPIPPPPSWYDLFRRVREKPVLYLGSKSLRNLEQFLNGYLAARYEHGIPITVEITEWGRFDHWVSERLREFSTRSSADKILQRAANDEAAFDEYFRLFDEYRSEKEQARSAVPA